jgi:hypothetical protein
MKQHLSIAILGFSFLSAFFVSCNDGGTPQLNPALGIPPTTVVSAETMSTLKGCPPNCQVNFASIVLTNQDTLHFVLTPISAEEYNKFRLQVTPAAPAH